MGAVVVTMPPATTAAASTVESVYCVAVVLQYRANCLEI